MSKLRLRVRRQDAPDKPETARWEVFELPFDPSLTAQRALELIRARPQTTNGEPVSPIAWEASCLEESCGSCAMLINGRARPACTAKLADLGAPAKEITLEPMSTFPVLRDLVVDRSRMSAALRTTKAWVDLDGMHPTGHVPRERQADQRRRGELADCIHCGCCLEGCPQTNDTSPFIGPAALNEARRLQLHPEHDPSRLEHVMGDGGISWCGKAQTCVDVCPKDIPLTESLGELSRATTRHFLFGWLRR